MKQEHTINATESILLFPEGAITGTELDQIESQVDSAIPKSVLAKYARNEAIPHLLRAFEDHARIYLPQIIAKNPIEYVFGLKLAQDSMEFAMNWIFRFSKPNSPRPNFDPNHDGYLEFSEIRRQAEEYSRVFDFLSLVRRGWAQAKKGPDGTIRLATTSPGIDAHEVFETMTHFGVDQIALPPTRCSVLERIGLRQLIRAVDARRVAEGKVKYQVPTPLFEEFKTDLSVMTKPLWQLNPAWSLGEYTVAEFRSFWVALLALVTIHDSVCMASGVVDVVGGALDSLILTHNKKRWSKKLADAAGLTVDVVKSILSDLTYRPELYEEGRKKPDVTFQPFFDLGNEVIAASGSLIKLSNAERNIWDLVSIIRPKLHGDLRNEKEGLWLDELIPQCNRHGVLAKDRIDFTGGNIDLLLLDQSDKFGVVLELKWLNAPDRLRQVASTIKELNGGIEQAETALKWCDDHRTDLAMKAELAPNALADFTFEAAVLSRNTTGGGRIKKSGIPVLSERVFHWVLGEPHHKSLRTLHRVGQQRSYLPIVNEVYTESDTHGTFGGVTFVGENFGFLPIRDYDPRIDIKFSV